MANWFYTVTGGACIVTAGRNVSIPKIPGKLSADMELCEVSLPNNISSYLQKNGLTLGKIGIILNYLN